MDKYLRTIFKAGLLPIGVIATCWAVSCASASAIEPETFASPEQAVHSLVDAFHDNDTGAFLKIFGPEGRDLVSSGDPVADKDARARFFAWYSKDNKIQQDGEDRATLVLGAEQWPFPIPIVRQDGAWHFDAAAGTEEVLNRRIGRNELNAINVCHGYVQAQLDYARDRESAGKPAEYAAKFLSTPGRHDGLYWPVKSGEKDSPIWPQLASARSEGYIAKPGHENQPYHGYYYRILTRQGPAAPGGARDYVAGDKMTGGFGLLAFPAKYGDSGVMTFMVNQNGLIYAKDLGPDTSVAAARITDFNPDTSWKTR